MKALAYFLLVIFLATAAWGMLARDWRILGAATALQILMLLSAHAHDRSIRGRSK